jgi:hypothetical protein
MYVWVCVCHLPNTNIVSAWQRAMYGLAKKTKSDHHRTPRHSFSQPHKCIYCVRRFGTARALLKHAPTHTAPVIVTETIRPEREGKSVGHVVIDEPGDDMSSSDSDDGDKSEVDNPFAPGEPALEQDADPPDSDDGFGGMSPDASDSDSAGHYPFTNFTFGLCAVAFDTLGLTDDDRRIIIACILTKGFNIEELRCQYSHDSMSRAINNITRELHPNSVTVISTKKLAKRKKQKLDPEGRVLPQNQAAPHHQSVISIGDVVCMDFANPTTRPLMRFGIETPKDSDPVRRVTVGACVDCRRARALVFHSHPPRFRYNQVTRKHDVVNTAKWVKDHFYVFTSEEGVSPHIYRSKVDG